MEALYSTEQFCELMDKLLGPSEYFDSIMKYKEQQATEVIKAKKNNFSVIKSDKKK